MNILVTIYFFPSSTYRTVRLDGRFSRTRVANARIAYTLDRIYSRIKSGNFWSENTDDYFDLLAWHPYVMANIPCDGIVDMFTKLDEPDNLWKDFNDAAYRAMCKYGDGHKQVLLTEIGKAISRNAVLR